MENIRIRVTITRRGRRVFMETNNAQEAQKYIALNTTERSEVHAPNGDASHTQRWKEYRAGFGPQQCLEEST